MSRQKLRCLLALEPPQGVGSQVCFTVKGQEEEQVRGTWSGGVASVQAPGCALRTSRQGASAPLRPGRKQGLKVLSAAFTSLALSPSIRPLPRGSALLGHCTYRGRPRCTAGLGSFHLISTLGAVVGSSSFLNPCLVLAVAAHGQSELTKAGLWSLY